LFLFITRSILTLFITCRFLIIKYTLFTGEFLYLCVDIILTEIDCCGFDSVNPIYIFQTLIYMKMNSNHKLFSIILHFSRHTSCLQETLFNSSRNFHFINYFHCFMSSATFGRLYYCQKYERDNSWQNAKFGTVWNLLRKILCHYLKLLKVFF